MTDDRKNNITPMRKADSKEKGQGPNVRFPPPLLFFALITLGLVADRFLPLPSFAFGPYFGWAGGALIACGIALIIISLGLFGAEGENPEPWTISQKIIARGPYRHTRNPMYLGMTAIMFGIALWRDSAGVLALLPVAVIIIDRLVIQQEEKYLIRKFGKAYTDYQKSVRRWL